MAKKIKKDFDKDKMYQKIMPTMEPDTVEQPPPPLELSGEPSQLPPGEEPQLHNLMERMLRERLDRTIDILGCCNCERCKMDIMAISLNALPSAYGVVWDNDPSYIKKLRGSYEVKVTAALIQAVRQVNSAPRHE